ncbi:T9SS type A sorting domain-containing protein [bacterium]|nr:T9SS type A sorting domain-containing protein [bacterium]
MKFLIVVLLIFLCSQAIGEVSSTLEIISCDDRDIVFRVNFPIQQYCQNGISELSADNVHGSTYLFAVPYMEYFEVDILDLGNPVILNSEYINKASGGDISPNFYEAPGVFSFRGVQLIPVTVNLPVQWSQEKGAWQVYDAITLRITFIDPQPGTISLDCFPPEFRNICQAHIMNSDYFNDKYNLIYEPHSTGYGARYIVIVHDAFYSQIQPLALWRHQKGFKTRVVTLSELGGNSFENIRNYIQNSYDYWDIKPEYVLLVGDSELLAVGTHDNYYPNTDNYYGMVDGDDYFADIFIGRIPANLSDDNAETIVNKVLQYELHPFLGGDDWFLKATCVVANDYDESDISYMEASNYIRDLLLSNGFIRVDLYTTEGGYSRSHVRNAINDGRAFVNYRGVAGSDWVDPFDNILYGSYINNINCLPVITSVTCLTNCFIDYDYYFCESWINYGSPSNLRGAVGTYGSTCASWNTPERSSLNKGFYRTILVDSVYSFGGAMVGGKFDMVEEFGAHSENTVKEYYDYNILGDPALSMWTAVPGSIEAVFPAIIPFGYVEYGATVTSGGIPLEGALVCVAAEDTSVYDYGYTDAAGHVSLFSFSIIRDTANITVTYPNHIPFIGKIAIQATGPYVLYVDHDLNDTAGGNGDHYPNPGEDIGVEVEFTNFGNETARGVRAFLRNTNPYVNMVDSLSVIGDIDSFESSTSEDNFCFFISPDCPNLNIMNFQLIVSDEAGSTWVSNMPPITVYLPQMELYESLVDDSGPGGNNDHCLDQGETASIRIFMDNLYYASLESLIGILRTDSEFITVFDSISDFGDCSPAGRAHNLSDPFCVTVSPWTPNGAMVEFQMLLEGGGGSYFYYDTLSFFLTVHQISADEVSGPDNWGYWAYDNTDGETGHAPAYNWYEIAPPIGPGEELTRISDADAETLTLNLPFDFNYYGETYSKVGICSNGFLELGGSTHRYGTAAPIPTEGSPRALIAPFWCDLDPGSGGSVYQYYDSDINVWILEFKGVKHYDSDYRESFQVLLYDPAIHLTPTGDGIIIFQYRYVYDISTTAVGIENYDGDIGLQYFYDDNYAPGAAPLERERAIKFTTEPPLDYSQPWLCYHRYQIRDSAGGDADGIPEAGENFELVVSLINLGGQTAIRAKGFLQPCEPLLILTDSSGVFENIGAHGEGNNEEHPFSLTIAPDAPDTLVYLELKLWYNDSNSVNRTYIPFAIGWYSSIESVDIMPGFRLNRVYPNPFNSLTRFSFQADSQEEVKLIIADLSGRQVYSTIKLNTVHGESHFAWKGLDQSGKKLPSGIYFYTLSNGCEAFRGKVILVK